MLFPEIPIYKVDVKKCCSVLMSSYYVYANGFHDAGCNAQLS